MADRLTIKVNIIKLEISKTFQFEPSASEQEIESHVEEALILREKRRLLTVSKNEEMSKLSLTRPLSFTWLSLLECIISVYDQASDPGNKKSLCWSVDLQKYFRSAEKQCAMLNAITLDSPSSKSGSVKLKSSLTKEAATEGSNKGAGGVKRKKADVAPETDKSLEPQPKRRSARMKVKTSKVKEEEEEEFNWTEVVGAFIPETLRLQSELECEIELNSQPDSACNVSREESTIGEELSAEDVLHRKQKEMKQVSDLVNRHYKHATCMDIMRALLTKLCCENFPRNKWSVGIGSLVTKVFVRYRKHIQLPCFLSEENDIEEMKILSLMLLQGLEGQLDAWLSGSQNHDIHYPSNATVAVINRFPAPSTPSSADENMLIKMGVEGCLADVVYLQLLMETEAVPIATSALFRTRFFWMQARLHMLLDNSDMARQAFDMCSNELEKMKNNGEPILLLNCNNDSVISLEKIKEKCDTISGSQPVEGVRDLLLSGQFEQVVIMLAPSILRNDVPKHIKMTATYISNLIMLVEAFSALKIWSKCVSTSLLFLSGLSLAVSSVSSLKKQLSTFLNTIYTSCISQKDCALLIHNHASSFIRHTTRLLEFIMGLDANDVALTVLPWLMLHKILKYSMDEPTDKQIDEQDEKQTDMNTNEEKAASKLEKDEQGKKKAENDGSDVDVENIDDDGDSDSDKSSKDENELPQSLQLLISAHEHLGRKSACCNDNGILLLELLKEIDSCMKIKEATMQSKRVCKLVLRELSSELEQCFNCLYGFKKTRGGGRKGIQDHNVAVPIPLTWEYAKFLYSFYKPAQLPEIDLKTHTITMEVQNIFQRIVTVVPQNQIEIFTYDKLQTYIDGKEAELEYDKDKERKATGIDDMFYYLADYYFKNKEFSKALKFYMHDVTINPNRYQSWAAMGLARAQRLEEKINTCEICSEGPIRKHITATLKCYQHAVQIDNTRCVVIEEYGGTAYMLSTYFSRRAREESQDLQTPVPPTPEFQSPDSQLNTMENFSKRSIEMLMLTQKCFTQAKLMATDSQGDIWLHYYMLGKAAEKLKKPPEEYLELYQKSLLDLHECGGSYLKKISYHGPPKWAIQSVELFYRIHTSILKLIFASDIKDRYEIAEKHLGEVRKQPMYVEWAEKEVEKEKNKAGNSRVAEVNSKEIHNQSSSMTVESEGPLSIVSELLNEITNLVVGVTKTENYINVTETSNSMMVDKDIPTHVVSDEKNVVTSSNTLNSPGKEKQNAINGANLQNATVIKDSASPGMAAAEEVKVALNTNPQTIPTDTFCTSTPQKTHSEEFSSNLKSLVERTDSLSPSVLTTPPNVQSTSLANLTPSSSNDLATDDVQIVLSTLLNRVCEGSAGIDSAHACKYTDITSQMDEAIKDSHKYDVASQDYQVSFENDQQRQRHNNIMRQCMEGFDFCLQRFPEYYKSQYRIAKTLVYCHEDKDYELAKEFLLGSSSNAFNEKYGVHLPTYGIFSDKKKTNLFQNLWRIPVDEIDRPGSFCSHLYRSIDLLLDVLYRLDDSQTLLHMSHILHKSPDKDKKYIRDSDRAYLAIKGFDLLVSIIQTRMKAFRQWTMPTESNLVNHQSLLVDLYDVYKHAQKAGNHIKLLNSYLREVYSKLKPVFSEDSMIDEVTKLCQLAKDTRKKGDN